MKKAYRLVRDTLNETGQPWKNGIPLGQQGFNLLQLAMLLTELEEKIQTEIKVSAKIDLRQLTVANLANVIDKILQQR